jgi:hypothetical protein
MIGETVGRLPAPTTVERAAIARPPAALRP